jgi:chromosome segregation ATPase
MKREIDKLKMELGIANATEQDLDQTVQELELKLTAAKTEAAETKRRLFVLTGVEQEKGALAQEVERLQQQISAVRAERAADHSEAFERNDEMADLQSQLDVARATVKALTREAAASKVDRDEIVRANTERDALSARMKEMEASQAALANLSTEKDQKRSDVGLMNSRIADLEEEMSIVLKKLEKSIVGLASKVKRGASDTLRLNMNLKMQASHLESYKRQLADAEKRLGKGSKQSKREIESLQVGLASDILILNPVPEPPKP